MGCNALYAVFTSGSTGKPKGAVNEHASFCTAAKGSGRALRMSSQTRAFQSASFTPSVARLLDAQALSGLQALELASEPMLHTDLQKWADHVLLVNAYGIAECSVYSVIHPAMPCTAHPHNIGFAVGCVTWIVDQDNSDIPLPVGEVGELVLEGVTVGRGYLNNQTMTADAFPLKLSWLSSFRGETPYRHRLYKTGDLVQYQDDGSLVYVGRKDTQAKVDGQRIELSEVEWHKREILGPQNNVVAEMIQVHRNGSKQTILIAFVRLQDAGEDETYPTSDLLFRVRTDHFRVRMEMVENELRARVPTYMIPRAFVAFDYIPLSIPGKTDRRRLQQEAASLR
ncbi:hypothetical protein ANO14919_140420 [Xylariales sp. No.14919]|nr:hypothetical protein ANO14919_140420 [Xylariales sp. No.14919]